MPDQTGFFASLKNAAAKVFTYSASITLAGTDGKTITVTQDTSLDEAVAMSSKAPKASPLFTGDVKGTTAGGIFGSVNPTNTGITYAGSAGSVSVLDNQTFTFDVGNAAVFIVFSGNTAASALFYADYLSGTITKLVDTGSNFEITDVDTGKIAVFKSATSFTVSIKNYSNSTSAIYVNALGRISAATAPA